MPVLKHAKKKMRQDKKRTLQNKRVKSVFKALLKKARQNPSKESVSKAFSSLDKAAKQNIIHKNKAARLKSSLAKLLTDEKKPATLKTEKVEKKVTKTTKKSTKETS